VSYYTDLFDQMFIVACRIHDIDIRDTLLPLIIKGKEHQETTQRSHICDQIFFTACRISDVDTRDTLLVLTNKVKEHLQEQSKSLSTDVPLPQEESSNDTPSLEKPFIDTPVPEEPKFRRRRRS